MTIMIAKIMKIIMRALLTLSLSAFMFSRIVLFWAVAEMKQKLRISKSEVHWTFIPLKHLG